MNTTLGLHHVRDLPAHVPLYDWLFLRIRPYLIVLLAGAAGCGSNRADETHRISDTTATLRDTLNPTDTMPQVREGPTNSAGDNR